MGPYMPRGKEFPMGYLKVTMDTLRHKTPVL